jgi:hypothetical protein
MEVLRAERGEIMTVDKGGRSRKTGFLLTSIALLLVLAVGIVSCGGTSKSTSGKSSGTTKLPQGMTKKDMQSKKTTGNLTSSQTQSASSSAQQQKASTPTNSADVAGARFTVVNALRNDSNKKVISSDQREVLGDYLEVELTVENIGDKLVDLTQYSFRLKSPGIEADTYSDYYGGPSLYGTYVSGHTIGAALLDYSNLKPVDYKLRKKEKLDSVFVFFDLNPLDTVRNEGVTKDNTNLVIRKVQGSNSGAEGEISLSGYPD